VLFERRPGRDLNALVYRFWFGPNTEAAGKRSHEILPDGYVDLLLELSEAGCKVRLFGPATKTTSIQTNNDCDYLGVRFCPGKASHFAGVKPAELIDNSVELTDFRRRRSWSRA
jgi:hypothetical protein